MKWFGRLLGLAAAALVVAYLGLVGALYSQQRTLLFRPDPTRVAPAQAGLPRAQEVALNGPGEPLLIAWHVPPAEAGKPVFLYLHGNASNLARRARRFDMLTSQGEGLLALSWRGYGGSEGQPSEAGFHADVGQALEFLRRQGIPAERIVIYGESLGTGMAVMTAARLAETGTPVRALILDSPYESIAAIAADRYWWVPVNLLMRDPFRADRFAPKVRQPVFAIHCRNDWITPYEGGRRLVSLLAGPTRFVTVDRRCHVPTLGGAAADALQTFLGEVFAGKAAAATP